MKEMTKKVVILNNFSSPYVSEAIVVLKDYNPKLEGKAIEDAEMIVSRYIERIEKNGQFVRTARKKSKLTKFIVGSIIAALIIAAVKCFI